MHEVPLPLWLKYIASTTGLRSSHTVSLECFVEF